VGSPFLLIRGRRKALELSQKAAIKEAQGKQQGSASGNVAAAAGVSSDEEGDEVVGNGGMDMPSWMKGASSAGSKKVANKKRAGPKSSPVASVLDGATPEVKRRKGDANAPPAGPAMQSQILDFTSGAEASEKGIGGLRSNRSASSIGGGTSVAASSAMGSGGGASSSICIQSLMCGTQDIRTINGVGALICTFLFSFAPSPFGMHGGSVRTFLSYTVIARDNSSLYVSSHLRVVSSVVQHRWAESFLCMGSLSTSSQEQEHIATVPLYMSLNKAKFAFGLQLSIRFLKLCVWGKATCGMHRLGWVCCFGWFFAY
jgi:hypothetical protein